MTMSGKILIIDDEKNVAFVIAAMLEKAGFQPKTLNNSKLALEYIQAEAFDLIITDLHMEEVTGMDILDYCHLHRSELPVVMITAFGTVEAAVNALKKGAFDFITKPFDQTDLLNTVKKAIATHEQRKKEPIYLRSMNTTFESSSIIGKSNRMQEIFKVIHKISQSSSTVLILGESGTGKELIALEIHKNSDRANKPFIKLNCAAIPTTLIESELFGYEKGAFTGASSSKPGKFELANGGTLFLDEVAEMPLEMQVKLLRILQQQEFERVGGVNTIKVDVRIITATNRDLDAEVKVGRFREDLFYRLNVVPINLPALRERKGDLDLLVVYFIGRFNEKLKKAISGITTGALIAFHRYHWPGNIRQLENILERMMLMSDDVILTEKDLPEEISHLVEAKTSEESESLSLKEIVKKYTQTLEKDLIERALEEKSGNVTKAAERLGLSRKGLQLKIKELGIAKKFN